MNRVVRHIVEESETRVARRPKMQKDGSIEIYVTRRHARVLAFIGASSERDEQPTQVEIAASCGYGSREGAWHAVNELANMGLLSIDRRRARSMKLTKEGKHVYEAWLAIEKRSRKARLKS